MTISDKEYEMIKAEINYWLNEENKYWVFVYTAIGTIAALTLQQNKPLILIGIYFIILPAIAQLIHVKTNYIFLGTYLAVNHSESYRWEEMSYKFKIIPTKAKLLNNLIIKIRNISLNFICISTIFLYIYLTVFEGTWKCSDYLIILFAFIVSIYVWFLSNKYNKDGEIRREILAAWSDII